MHKRCWVTWLLAMLPFALVSAQEIRDIQTDVYLFVDGSALVKQVWDQTVVSGTERYIPIDNPGKSYIHDFRVFENGKEYANDGRKWNSDRSREAKTHRCGIIEKSGGNIELCWGQGELGDHTWTLYYTIDNLVLSYPDGDGFHWHFLNDEWDPLPQHASITIHNETDGEAWYWDSPDSCNVQMWGFGMVGQSWIDDGKLSFESTEPFQYRSFFSAAVRFEKGLFHPLETGEGTFEELKQEAMEGSDYESSQEEPSLFDKILVGIGLLAVVGVPALLILVLIIALIKKIYWRISGNRYDKGIFGVKKITGWFRDAPLGGNATAVYSLLQEGDHLAPNKQKVFPNLVSAYFLKWIQDGIIRIEPDPKKQEHYNLRFREEGEQQPAFSDTFEARIYSAALSAAGENRVLEANEFKKWSYQHDYTVASWPKEAIDIGRPMWTAASEEERRHAVEFKNFLEDFTLADQRTAPEVGLWKQYLVLAASFGIADKVAKNFEKLFPQVMETYRQQTGMLDNGTFYYVLRSLNNSSYAMMSSAINRQEARQAAAAARRRASGGGGSISFGGGGGGFGGGHGGGSR